MFKILYGAGNRNGAKYQLLRLLEQLNHDIYTIKTAGYRSSNLYFDWSLDALLDFMDPERISTDSDNFEIFFKQVKHFDPDLVISDADAFTSYAGQLLNKPVWQASPTLLQHIELPLIGQFKYKIIMTTREHSDQLLQNIIINSNKNYIYSHYGDTALPLKLPDNFEWIRPYHYLGNVSPPCQHYVVSMVASDKVIKSLSKYDDAVIFSDHKIKHHNIIYKSANNIKEYACNVKNCQYYVSDGTTDTLADAFYNQKKMVMMPDLYDRECNLNMLLMEYYKLATISYDGKIEENELISPIKWNNEIQFLHQKIDQFAKG